MAFLTQSRFPRLWLFMQNMIGCNASKQALAIKYYSGQKRVLEVGCSVGNVSEVFRSFPEVDFTGIDIDENAIALAKYRFRNDQNFSFSLTALEELSRCGQTYDYVLFAGMLHHVDNDTGLRLLRDAVNCTADGGRLVIYEPEAVRSADGWLLRSYYALFEQGLFLRTRDSLQLLVESAGIALESIEDRMMSPGIVERPYVARFNLLVGTPAAKVADGATS